MRAMNRVRFISLATGLIAVGSLLALSITVPAYQCWLASTQVPLFGGDWVLNLEYCFRYDDTLHWQIWLPIYLAPVVSILPTLPALPRLGTLGRSRWWALLGLVPVLNLPLYAYLALAPWPISLARRLHRYFPLAGLCLIAAWLYYHLLLYLPWLAAKS